MVARGADRSTEGRAIKPLESGLIPLFFFLFLARQGERRASSALRAGE